MTTDKKAWKILIVDDDEVIHFLTVKLLGGFVFEGKKLEFYHAYSKAEAEKIIAKEEDIAVVLLDVVMEEWDSGLKFVNYVRKNIKNNAVRLILRTGQPDHAPEKDTIRNYDINDYKTKTELTSKNKLYTAVIVALRSYRDIRIIQDYSKTLEAKVQERTKTIRQQNLELSREKRKTDKLLSNTLPAHVVRELKRYGKTHPRNYENVSVYFSDVVGFTKLSSKIEPRKLISELNLIFTVFDDIMERNGCERIKTIGDAYLAVSGMHNKIDNPADNLVMASLEILDYLERRNKRTDLEWQIRIGINSGSVVGGVVGVRKYIFDVFGDTINTASRMESNSEPMKINVSENTYKQLTGAYSISDRGIHEIKGKGRMRMFFVEGVKELEYNQFEPAIPNEKFLIENQ